MKEARLYIREDLRHEDQEDQEVACALCHHRCRIRSGRRGRCGVRENQEGVLYSLVYGRLVAENIDPVEKSLFSFSSHLSFLFDFHGWL